MAYTQLTPTATPGRRYSFSPKTAAAVPGKGVGTFTSLSVLAIPGGRHTFTAKQEVEYKPEVVQTYYGSRPAEQVFPYDYYYKKDLIIRDDQEIIELIIIIMKSGMI